MLLAWGLKVRTVELGMIFKEHLVLRPPKTVGGCTWGAEGWKKDNLTRTFWRPPKLTLAQTNLKAASWEEYGTIMHCFVKAECVGAL